MSCHKVVVEVDNMLMGWLQQQRHAKPRSHSRLLLDTYLSIVVYSTREPLNLVGPQPPRQTYDRA